MLKIGYSIMEEDNFFYHPQSYADPRGRVFYKMNKIYREIRPDWEIFYREFISSSCFKSLIEDGLLIDTSIFSDNENNGILILEHKKIPVVSFPGEWSFEALKDCALLILELQQRLMVSGYGLHDGHPFNVLFDGCKPVFIDFTSITRRETNNSEWSALTEFKETILNPLRIMSRGHSKIARAILCSDKFLTDDEVSGLLGNSNSLVKIDAQKKSWSNFYKRKSEKRPLPTNHTASTIEELKSIIDELEYPNKFTDWTGYYDDEFLPIDLPVYERAKMQSVRDVLVEYAPKNVLDVASNRGWFAQLAAYHGARVVAFDIDEISINQCYEDCRRSNLDIQPLVMNLINPTPGIGIMNMGFPSALSRFRTEMVLALAIVHHLVFTSHLRFSQIVETFDKLTEKYLLIEFIPKEDTHISGWYSPDKDWYTLDNFKTELAKFFGDIVVLPSDPDPRVILFCKR